MPRPLTGGSSIARRTAAAVAACTLVAPALLVPAVTTAATLPGGVGPDVTLSGFGTLGYAALDDPNAEYRTGKARDGADERGSFAVDTRLGLQLDAVLTERLSATVQGIARDDETGEPAAELEWGFVRFLPSDSTTLRVGRMSLPIFSLSDYREVGYANVLLRPPEDVYVQIPIRRFDGIDLTADFQVGETLLRVQLYGGNSSERINDGLEPDAAASLGVSFVVERGDAQLRLSHLTTQLKLGSASGDIAAVYRGILQAEPAVPSLAAIAEDFDGSRTPLRFDAIGVAFRPGRWFIDAELARRRIDSWVSDVDSFSVAGGARVGDVTPYAFASALSETGGDRRVSLPDGPLDDLEAGINAFYEPRDQRTVGLGLRWDPLPKVALKVQAERISRDVVGISFLRRQADDGGDDGRDVTLFSAAADFVF